MKAPNQKELLAQLAALQAEVAELKKRKANKNGGSKEKARGCWCTPKKWADRLGHFDLDAFSNPRSNISAGIHLMLERGDDAFGPAGSTKPGRFFAAPTGGVIATGERRRWPTESGVLDADGESRVFIQPPYEIVMRAIAHYEHTRFVALLRFDPSTKWFRRLYRICELVAVPVGERLNFEPPPGVKASTNTFPHAFYYRRAADAPREVLSHCIAWRLNRG